MAFGHRKISAERATLRIGGEPLAGAGSRRRGMGRGAHGSHITVGPSLRVVDDGGAAPVWQGGAGESFVFAAADPPQRLRPRARRQPPLAHRVGAVETGDLRRGAAVKPRDERDVGVQVRDGHRAVARPAAEDLLVAVDPA